MKILLVLLILGLSSNLSISILTNNWKIGIFALFKPKPLYIKTYSFYLGNTLITESVQRDCLYPSGGISVVPEIKFDRFVFNGEQQN